MLHTPSSPPHLYNHLISLNNKLYNSLEQNPSWKANSYSAILEILQFQGSQMSVTVYTAAQLTNSLSIFDEYSMIVILQRHLRPIHTRACRAHAIPLSCRADKCLECVFPI